jgi:hypothetical protein
MSKFGWLIAGLILGELDRPQAPKRIEDNVEEYETVHRRPDWFDKHDTGLLIGLICVLVFPLFCLKFILSRNWLFGFIFVIFPLMIGLSIIFMRYRKSKKERKWLNKNKSQ